MTNDLYPFKTRIQRDKFLKMKFEEGNYAMSERGAVRFEMELNSQYPGIANFVKTQASKTGREIHDIIMDLFELKYE